VQTLLAFAHTLFDFARQHGVEGEKLAQINRWELTGQGRRRCSRAMRTKMGCPTGSPLRASSIVKTARCSHRHRIHRDCLGNS
jgi:hypothetical protein